jgi:hypothetical protein
MRKWVKDMHQIDRRAWLEKQLTQIDGFIQRDTLRLQQQPGNFSIKLSLESWQTHRSELLEELGEIARREQPLSFFFSKHMPRLWGRWFSARLMATTACSKWLSAANPDFTRWQRIKRNALCVAFFLKPGALPLTITIRQHTV